jgi:UDP-N-acetylmuramoyl-tripeptide--D-alanyl-D-alanine ligase
MSLYLAINTILSSIITLFLANVWSLAFTHYIQRKEYRLDRLKDFWTYENGKQLLLSKTNIFTAILLISLTLINNFQLPILLGISLIAIYKILNQGLFRPKFTSKIKLILGTYNLIILASLFLFDNYQELILICSIPLILGITTLATIITNKLKQKAIQQAAKKINNHRELMTIGITGSFGKSSTKEFVASLVSQKGLTLKTPENINTEIGIANLIKQNLSQKHKFFVCEMGAYQKTEIALIAKMVKPKIGIITQVAPQHLSLFGSIEAIKKAKSELVNNLQPGGIAILNYDNEFTYQIGQELKQQKITTLYYSNNLDLKPEQKSELSCFLLEKKILPELKGQILKINLYGQELELETQIYAPHLTENLLPAILAAFHCDLTIPELKRIIPTLSLADNQIRINKKTNLPLTISDTYNMNLSGSMAAIKLAQTQNHGRIYLVTMGIPELGEASNSEHQKLAEFLLANRIHTFVLNKNTYTAFTNTAISANLNPQEYFTYVEKLKELNTIILKKVTDSDTIVLLNRVPDFLKNILL